MSVLREADAEPLPGYRLIKPLGTGGFGEVWKCEAPGGIHKAIKFVYGNLHSTDGNDVRAEQEFRALQKMKEVRHPFVLTIERIDVVDGEVVIVMELADKSLYDRLMEEQGSGRIGINRTELLGYLSDAADGLDYLLDSCGLQHLDIKPRNLFMVSGRVKVADFGLVKQLERNSSSGLMGGMSPMYAAPETFSGKISKQSDQYSLAIVYMELLTGTRPFAGRNIRQLAMQHMAEAPDLRALSEEDRPIVARALEKEPAKRFPSCSAFIQALWQVQGALPGPRTRSMVSMPDMPIITTPPKSESVPAVPKSTPTMPKIPNLERSRIPQPNNLYDSGHVFGPNEDSMPSQMLTQASAEMGVLRPTILIGLGSYGRKALRELRHRLLDRLGDLSLVPVIRFLYLDSDQEAADRAIAGPADHALSPEHFFPLPLQPVANYRRRMLDHISEWLPREKLFGMPRSLQPQGSRALGRLAFSDNYLRFNTRFRREMQVATHPESLAQAMSHTGLVLRDNLPRIYIFANATGGSSGMLVDLGFAIRRMLTQQKFKHSTIDQFLFCGAAHDPATPKQELANLYATLTELNHFQDASISFHAQYGGPDGPKLNSEGNPYSSIYLMQLENRSPEAIQENIAHLATYLTQEISTPLGLELERIRRHKAESDRTPFRSFGTYSIWFPRGLMLRSAARQMCQKLLEEWQQLNSNIPQQHVHNVVDQALKQTRIDPETMGPEIEKTANVGDGTPVQGLNNLLLKLEQNLTVAINRGTMSEWANQSYEQIKEWVGNRAAGDLTPYNRVSRLSRSLQYCVSEIAHRWVNRFTADAMKLMEMPGRRIAASEEALLRFVQVCNEHNATVGQRLNDLSVRAQQSRADVQAAFDSCMAGSGFSLFGGRSTRMARHFYDYLTTFARNRLAEDVADAMVQFYRRVGGGLEERVRDLTFCRQRLGHLQQMLETPGDPFALGIGIERSPATNRGPNEAYSETSRFTIQMVLPYGESDIDQAAKHFLQTLDPTCMKKLDEVLQALVLAPLGGLYAICQKTSDLMRQLASPLIDQTCAYLSEQLPVTDVAQAEFSTSGNRKEDLSRQLEFCYDRARPLVSGFLNDQRTYLIIPSSESAIELAEHMTKQLENLEIVQTPGPSTDLTICREQTYLRHSDLQEILQYCQSPYQELKRAAFTSPHARFDILEWLPLDA